MTIAAGAKIDCPKCGASIEMTPIAEGGVDIQFVCRMPDDDDVCPVETVCRRKGWKLIAAEDYTVQ